MRELLSYYSCKRETDFSLTTFLEHIQELFFLLTKARKYEIIKTKIGKAVKNAKQSIQVLDMSCIRTKN